LKEYILIDSRSVRVDIFSRAKENTWLMRSYTQLSDVVPFDALHIEIPLNTIYGRAKF